ncbi:hypothetical protein [Nocardia wallacei]|uniref:hypothetical protein n=1 Tax=Nocardia wallacei TaxID=480035 RepID=UPI0024560E07|nr:hypothetical protein [Nocardia wallacei]
MTTTEDETKRKRGAALERAATLLTAAIASAVAAQGMYVFFAEATRMPTPLLLLCFAFIELMVVTSAMRARRSQLDTGSAGVDGIAMWVLTIMSGVLAATHAGDLGVVLLRLLAPLIAAWGWERSMALERRQLTGQAGGLNWRWSPTRLLVRWGIADPTDRSTAEVAVERRLADLARAADKVRLVRTTGGSGRRERRVMQQLHRAIDKAADDGLVLGEPGIRERLAQHLEGRFAAYTLPDYTPRTDWSRPAVAPEPPFTPDRGPGGGADIDEELDQLLAADTLRSAGPALAVRTASADHPAPHGQTAPAPALPGPARTAPEPAPEATATPAPEVRVNPAPGDTEATPHQSAGPAPAIDAAAAADSSAGAATATPTGQGVADVRGEEVQAGPAPTAETTPHTDAGVPEVAGSADPAPGDAGSDAAPETPAPQVRTPHQEPSHVRPHRPAPRSATPAPAPAPGARIRTSLAPVQASAGQQARALAEQVQASGAGRRLDTGVVARVLEMAEKPESVNAIHDATGVHHNTIKRIMAAADELTATASGGQIINLRSRS